MACLACTMLLFTFAIGCGTVDSGEGSSGSSGGATPHAALSPHAEPDAEAITAANLFDHERYWPYRVELTEPWGPADRPRPFEPGTRGVLVRLIDRDTARVDFAGLGVHEVPISTTDLVASARQIAAGKLHKFGPNLLVSLGPRLVSTSGDAPKRVGPSIMNRRLVLSVFADPAQSDFGQMAEALSTLEGSDERFAAILFPKESLDERAIFDAVKRAGWEVPFVEPRLSKSYTDGQLRQTLRPPAILLSTDEGRLLYEGAWNENRLRDVRAVLESHLARIGGGRTVPYHRDVPGSGLGSVPSRGSSSREASRTGR